jgi:hypothetical protein
MVLKIYLSGLKFDRWEVINTAANYKKWERLYLPPGGVNDKTVLVAGARCGGDVWFYFNHGAKKVIAIEPDTRCTTYLKRNAAKFNWNVDVIERGIRLSDFELPHDFAEMNIEGYEMILLEGPVKLQPTVLEAHCAYIADKLAGIGFRVIDGPYEYLGKCIMANW